MSSHQRTYILKKGNVDLKGSYKVMRLGPLMTDQSRLLWGSGIWAETWKMRMNQPFAKLCKECRQKLQEVWGLVAGKSLSCLENIGLPGTKAEWITGKKEYLRWRRALLTTEKSLDFVVRAMRNQSFNYGTGMSQFAIHTFMVPVSWMNINIYVSTYRHTHTGWTVKGKKITF